MGAQGKRTCHNPGIADHSHLLRSQAVEVVAVVAGKKGESGKKVEEEEVDTMGIAEEEVAAHTAVVGRRSLR